jgi:hypothetical protein
VIVEIHRCVRGAVAILDFLADEHESGRISIQPPVQAQSKDIDTRRRH